MNSTGVTFTRVIRAYLIGPAGMRNMAIGVNVLVFPSMLNTEYIPLVNLAPPWVWIAIWLTIGVLCILGGSFAWRRVSRIGLIASAASTVTLGGGIAIGTGVLASAGVTQIYASLAPIVSVLFLALAAADYIALVSRWTPSPEPVPDGEVAP